MALSLVNSSTNNTGATITLPASINSGDLIVIADHARGNSSETIPAGYTKIHGEFFDVAFDERVTVYYKISAGSDSSASVTGSNGNLQNSKIALVFRATGPIASIGVGTVNHFQGFTDPSAQTVLSGAATPPLIVFGVYASDVALASTSMSPAATGAVLETSGNGDMEVKYKLYDASPANVDVDMGTGSILLSFYATITATVSITADMAVGSFVFTGRTVSISYSIFMDAGAYVLTGGRLVFKYFGDLVSGAFRVAGGWHSPLPDSASTTTNRRVNRKWWAGLLNGRG